MEKQIENLRLTYSCPEIRLFSQGGRSFILLPSLVEDPSIPGTFYDCLLSPNYSSGGHPTALLVDRRYYLNNPKKRWWQKCVAIDLGIKDYPTTQWSCISLNTGNEKDLMNLIIKHLKGLEDA